MDPSPETTYAKQGIGVSEISPAQFLSSYVRYYKNNHLETALDGFYSHRRRTTSSEAKKREECLCVYVYVPGMFENIENWASVAWPLHIEYRKGYDLKCQWCRLLQCFVMVAFSPKARQALAY